VSDPRAPVAAIDLGTNTVLLLVARRAPEGGLEVRAEACESARLGERRALGDGGAPHSLAPAAVERTLGILAKFKARALGLGVTCERLRVTATAVLRRASDAQAFVRRCEEELDLCVEILSGPEEARLGRLALGPVGAGEWVTLDVGGGSTELSGDREGEQVSAPLGALVLTERFLGMGSNGPLEQGGAPALWEQTRRAFECFEEGSVRKRPVVLLGGSASNLACLEKNLTRFDPDQVEGTGIRTDAVCAWAERLLDLSLQERERLPIETQRAEILPAGLVCITALLERIGAQEAQISALGVRHGVALELLAR
jgi:exopolyphosphatase/guanosine-5'-triphosphate,3'-diphosphate pyrophosphatase